VTTPNAIQAATLVRDGSPRNYEPPTTCRTHYPGGSVGALVDYFPRVQPSQMTGGSASALELRGLSAPLVTAHRIGQQPKAAFTQGSDQQLPAVRLPASGPIDIIRVRPSLTDSSRLGAHGQTRRYTVSATSPFVTPERTSKFVLSDFFLDQFSLPAFFSAAWIACAFVPLGRPMQMSATGLPNSRMISSTDK